MTDETEKEKQAKARFFHMLLQEGIKKGNKLKADEPKLKESTGSKKP